MKERKKWIDYQQEQMDKHMHESCEKLMYTAQEGSTLDKIWKGEFDMKEQKPNSRNTNDMKLAIAVTGLMSGFLIGCLIGYNCTPPKVEVVEVIKTVGVVKPPPKKDKLEPLINAIIHVESRGNDSAVNVSSQAVGCMQIRPIMVREANRILTLNGSKKRYNLKDRYTRKKSIEIFHIWRNYHHKQHTWERVARCWNGGGKGHLMESTVGYWNKVKSNI